MYPGPTDPSLAPYLLTPVLQSMATTQPSTPQQTPSKQSTNATGDKSQAATLLQQPFTVAQLLQAAQQHKLMLFSHSRSDQTDNSKKVKEEGVSDPSKLVSNVLGLSSSQIPVALFSQPPSGIPMSHLIPIPANMAQQLIAAGRVKLQGPAGPVTVQSLFAPASEKGEAGGKQKTEENDKVGGETTAMKAEEKKEVEKKENTAGSEKKLEEERVNEQKESGGRSTRSTYKIPKKSSGNETKAFTASLPPEKLCCCRGCRQLARPTNERGPDFCSNECVVKHCKTVFRGWVAQQHLKAA